MPRNLECHQLVSILFGCRRRSCWSLVLSASLYWPLLSSTSFPRCPSAFQPSFWRSSRTCNLCSHIRSSRSSNRRKRVATNMEPPLEAVLVHGAGGGAWEWMLWERELAAAGITPRPIELLPSEHVYEKTHFSDYVQQIVAHSLPPSAEERGEGGRGLVLVGASMGGMLVLKAAERIIDGCNGHTLAAVVLVCSTIPANCRGTQAASSEGSEVQHTQPYPEVVRWAGGSYDATRTSIPDGSEEIWRFAHAKWRDESGLVLNEILLPPFIALSASEMRLLRRTRVLCVIPAADDTIPPIDQKSLADLLGASVLKYDGMSHVGALLGTRAPQVANDVITWLRHKA